MGVDSNADNVAGRHLFPMWIKGTGEYYLPDVRNRRSLDVLSATSAAPHGPHLFDAACGCFSFAVVQEESG